MSELLTVGEVARIMKISEDVVTKIFAKVDGVIDLGRAETRHKRQYRILRIPRAVLEAYLSKKAGRAVIVQVPERPERRRRSPNWMDSATMNLAKAAAHNGCTDGKSGSKKLLAEIARRAWILAAFPESEWRDILEIGWSDEEMSDEDIDAAFEAMRAGEGSQK
jgi:hypothetical protein